jgi:phage gpG-like protein
LPAPRFSLRGTKQLGAFGELGGEILFFEWHPSPEVVEREFMRLAGYLDNVEEPLIASWAVARKDTGERFDTETDPDGTHWVELDDEYLTRKLSEGYPPDILHRTGVLENQAPSGWVVMGETLVYNTAGLPEYGLLHQDGTGDPSDWGIARTQHRAQVKLRRAGDIAFLDYEGGIHDSMGIGRGNALPARPFIGLSTEAVEEIATIFDLWFDAGVSGIFIQTGPIATGTIQRRMPSGRFGSAIHR